MSQVTLIGEEDGWLRLDSGVVVPYPSSEADITLFGARVAPFGTYTTVAAVEAKIGTLQVGRVFHNAGVPSNWSGTLADSGMAGMDASAGCIVSVQTASDYTAYVHSIDSTLLDAGHVWMTWHHEPEGDYSTGADFVAEYNTFYSAIKAIDTRIKIGPIAEGDKYGRYPDSQATAGNYLPDASVCDFYGIDLYHPMNGNSGSGGAYDTDSVIDLSAYLDWQGWYDDHVKGRGKPIVVAEWGMYAEPDAYNTGAPNTTNESTKQANRATMIPLWFSSLQGLPETCEAVSYWYVDGKSTEKGTFRPSDTASNDALAALPRA